MGSAALTAQAEAIANQYLADIPATYDGRYSEIAKPDVVDTLLRGFTAGLKPTDCCEAAGIDHSTYCRWLKRAETEPNSAYASFAIALKKARADGKLALLERIKSASEKPQFWTAAAWTLERTDPEQFALRKEDSSAPKVIVQIGIQASDVQVQVGETVAASVDVQALSPPLTPDTHRLTVEK